MKKSIILTIATLLIAVISKSQINFESKYPIGMSNLKLCNLTTGGYKYYYYDKINNQIKMYNPNHTVFKTINVTPPPSGYIYASLQFVSDNLFNTDNLIEFHMGYSNSVTPFDVQKKIYNESNVLLFSSNTSSSGNGVEVINLNGSFKLKWPSKNGDSTNVYSLPGTLPCDVCGGPTSIVKSNTTTNTMPNAYPNPTSTQITIPYTLTNNDTKGKINIYDINGKILREYNVDNTFENLILDTQEFSAGTYYYNLTSNSGVSDAKKIIVIK